LPDDEMLELEDVPYVSPEKADQPPPPPPHSSLDHVEGAVVDHPLPSTIDQPPPPPPQLSST